MIERVIQTLCEIREDGNENCSIIGKGGYQQPSNSTKTTIQFL